MFLYVCKQRFRRLCGYPADTDVFKTSSGRLKKVTTSHDQSRRRQDVWKKMSDLRRLEYVLFKLSRRCSYLWRHEDVLFTTSWGRLIYDVLKTSDLRCLEDVLFTTSWRCLIYDVFKKSDLFRLEDVQFTTSSRRLIYDVLRTSDFRHLEDVRFASSSRHSIYDVFKTSVKRRLCSNVVVTSIQRQKKWFFLILYCLKYSENFKCSCLG